MRQRHKRFCREYIIDLNITRAAKAAGYKEETAAKQGSRLLKNVEVQVFIEKLLDKRAKKLEISADRVLRELARIGFSNITKIVGWSGGSVNVKDSSDIEENSVRTIQEIKEEQNAVSHNLKIKLYDKVRALELIGRHLAMWDKKEDPNEHEELENGTTIVRRTRWSNGNANTQQDNI